MPTHMKELAKSRPTTKSGKVDFCKIAIDYAERVIADKNGRFFGKWVRFAAKRFLNDLKRAEKKDAPFTFENWRANEACRFIETLPHVEGQWDTKTIVLHESHVFFVVQLFGFRKLDGNRRFTTALFAVARKNAKSTLSAAIMLYCLFCEGETGPQVISAATTGAQARIIFNIAKRMVELTPALREAFNAEPFANAVACYDNGGTFKPINAKASTQDGLNPSANALDEIHAHKDHDLLNVLKSAAGARKNPLFLYTTTEGYENAGPWSEIRHFAKQLLEGTVEADHYLALYYAIDDDDSELDPKVWVKANPLWDVNPILLKEIEKEAIEAKAMPGKMSEFKIKRCNRPASSATGEINLHKWKQCKGVVDLEWLKKYECVAAFDLASTMDMNALSLLWRIDGRYYCKLFYWVPEDQTKQRSSRGTATYDGWIKAGHIEQTSGNCADYAVIEQRIDSLREEFNIKAIAYDDWNARDLVNRLVEKSAPMVQFIQGGKSYSPAFQELEMAYMKGNLSHGGNPVLNWNASNLIARRDVNGNRSPDRSKSADKIDGMCALLMCFGLMLTQESNEITQGFVQI